MNITIYKQIRYFPVSSDLADEATAYVILKDLGSTVQHKHFKRSGSLCKPNRSSGKKDNFLLIGTFSSKTLKQKIKDLLILDTL